MTVCHPPSSPVPIAYLFPFSPSDTCYRTVSILSTACLFPTDADTSLFRVDPASGLPQISETQILAYVRHLSEDIGYRTVGTTEHAIADKWMIDTAYEVQNECERLVRENPGGHKLQCDVWHQQGSGSHRCVSTDRP
jgi:hypothetical protein